MITDRDRAKLDAYNARVPRHLRLTVSMVSNLLALRRTTLPEGWVPASEPYVYGGSLQGLRARGLADERGSYPGGLYFSDFRINEAGRHVLAVLGLGS